MGLASLQMFSKFAIKRSLGKFLLFVCLVEDAFVKPKPVLLDILLDDVIHFATQVGLAHRDLALVHGGKGLVALHVVIAVKINLAWFSLKLAGFHLGNLIIPGAAMLVGFGLCVTQVITVGGRVGIHRAGVVVAVAVVKGEGVLIPHHQLRGRGRGWGRQKTPTIAAIILQPHYLPGSVDFGSIIIVIVVGDLGGNSVPVGIYLIIAAVIPIPDYLPDVADLGITTIPITFLTTFR